MRNADQWRIFVVEEGEKNYVPELGRWQQKALLLQMCLRREWSHVLLPHFGTGGRLVGYAGILRRAGECSAAVQPAYPAHVPAGAHH